MTFFDQVQIASVALFALIILVKTVYLRTRRNINPIVIGGGKKGLLLFVEIFAFLGLLVWMIEILLYAFHSSFHIFPWPFDLRLINSEVARIIGVVLIGFGFLFFVWAYISFGDSWRVGFDVNKPGALVTRGVFSVSRNPIYLSLDLWFTGIFLINGTLVFLMLAILAIAVQHWQILQEEAFLLGLYGPQYQDYLAKTRRYVGF